MLGLFQFLSSPDVEEAEEHTGGSMKARHLCVLVHGLWGNPNHMVSIAKSLRAQYSHDELYLLLAKRNSGSFTYDGIERGAERLCAEIEEELKSIERQGGKMTQLSVIGYSLGGLVSRYAVGLLDSKGILDKMECLNFTTFASPHLGVRTPLKGWHNHVWNVLGARTLSMSGRQLFAIDNFRQTGRPLLSVMANENSIFIKGLRKFKRHTLYSNVVNDRSAVFYTTAIQKTDPYVDIPNIKVRYLEGYENVIIDCSQHPIPVPVAEKQQLPATVSSITTVGLRWVKRIPFLFHSFVLWPIGLGAYLLNSLVQNVRSSSRIRLHETGKAGVNVESYRVPLWIKDVRNEVEHAYETLNSSQINEYLRPGDEAEDRGLGAEQHRVMQRERRQSIPAQPTLALAPQQFEMIDSLNKINWRKYPVWIHNDRHAHAAMIVRLKKDTFDEGKVVLRHFVDEEFLPGHEKPRV